MGKKFGLVSVMYFHNRDEEYKREIHAISNDI